VLPNCNVTKKGHLSGLSQNFFLEMFELNSISTFLLALILSKSAIIRGYLKKAQYNFGSPEF